MPTLGRRKLAAQRQYCWAQDEDFLLFCLLLTGTIVITDNLLFFYLI